jgi:hypothetical protein
MQANRVGNPTARAASAAWSNTGLLATSFADIIDMYGGGSLAHGIGRSSASTLSAMSSARKPLVSTKTLHPRMASSSISTAARS